MTTNNVIPSTILFAVIPPISVTITILFTISCVVVAVLLVCRVRKKKSNKPDKVITQVNEAYADVTQLNLSLPTIKFNPSYEEININYERVY
jgi:predicted small secreted protein